MLIQTSLSNQTHQTSKILQLEEAEWIGLSWNQAITKQHEINTLANSDVPLKVKLGRELLERLDGKSKIFTAVI